MISICSSQIFVKIIFMTITIINKELHANGSIDKEHLKIYPYCGKLFGYESEGGSSRITNSRDSQTQYPWVVLVERTKLNTFIRYTVQSCGGTVITER